MSWILNAIVKHLVEAFRYVLILENYELKLRRDLVRAMDQCSTKSREKLACLLKERCQFPKLNKLWDELTCLIPLSECNCGAAKLMAERDNNNKVLQFLMGLGNHHDNVKNQILIIYPLPSVSKVFSMVQRVEKQREVHDSFTNQTAMAMKNFNPNKNLEVESHKGREKKGRKIAMHLLERNDNVKETCFKLNGFPEWYQEFKQKKRQSNGECCYSDAR